jgi:hypothetical protein
VSGWLLPRSALIRIDGATWVFVRESAELFVRREVTAAQMFDDGWLVTNGFGANDEVVEQGALALLALERGADAGEEG